MNNSFMEMTNKIATSIKCNKCHNSYCYNCLNLASTHDNKKCINWKLDFNAI